MPGRYIIHPFGHAALALAAAVSLSTAINASRSANAAAAGGVQAVHSDRPAVIDTGDAKASGALSPATRIAITLTLPLSHKAELDAFVGDVSNPTSASYGHYLTPAEFAAKYGASQTNYTAVVAWAKANGLTLTQTSVSRNTVSISATSAKLEAAFGVKFSNYVENRHGQEVLRRDHRAQTAPTAIASSVNGVYGLSDFVVGHPMHVLLTPATRAQMQSKLAAEAGQDGSVLAKSLLAGAAAVSGHNGALSPTDINTAYQMPALSDAGVGETLGCYEEGGYYKGDPLKYQKYYKLGDTPIIPRYVAGYGGAPTADVATETALDVDMELAMAPSAKAIYVYEAGSETAFATSLLDALTAVADDDKISVLDISYGLDEALELSDEGPQGFDDENALFERLAAEGISVFASAGDSGAYGDLGGNFDPASYNVADPGSEPLVTGVGGTTLLLRGGKDIEEISWNELGDYGVGATGGGVSDIWKLPSYQKFSDGAALTRFNGGSSTYRNVPDVAATADPYVGVDVYSSEVPGPTPFSPPGNWISVGGTSVSAPIWAGFTGVVNQQRHNVGLPVVGFANPLIYGIYNSDLGFFDEQYPQFDFDDVEKRNER